MRFMRQSADCRAESEGFRQQSDRLNFRDTNGTHSDQHHGAGSGSEQNYGRLDWLDTNVAEDGLLARRRRGSVARARSLSRPAGAASAPALGPVRDGRGDLGFDFGSKCRSRDQHDLLQRPHPWQQVRRPSTVLQASAHPLVRGQRRYVLPAHPRICLPAPHASSHLALAHSPASYVGSLPLSYLALLPCTQDVLP